VVEKKALFSIKKKGLKLFSGSSTSPPEERVNNGNVKELTKVY
jgi:hypothetical protein